MATIYQCQAAAKELVSKFGNDGVISEEDITKIIQEYCVVPVESSEKKKRGRPAGSKNKKKKKDEKELVEEVVEKKKRGRPAGSKNKKKGEKELVEEVVEKKKRGRPAGSKNKKTIALDNFIDGIHVEKVEEPKREQAATLIQKYARRFIVEYQSLLLLHTKN
uniref:Uncharacterized protein n=1 Tax=viral metagenome TaxID=1070528 RepID=A0A6C0C547_9ZZZZ